MTPPDLDPDALEKAARAVCVAIGVDPDMDSIVSMRPVLTMPGMANASAQNNGCNPRLSRGPRRPQGGLALMEPRCVIDAALADRTLTELKAGQITRDDAEKRFRELGFSSLGIAALLWDRDLEVRRRPSPATE